MAPAIAIFLTVILAMMFVPLALTEKRSLILRSAYVLVGMLFTFMLGELFIRIRSGEDHHVLPSQRSVIPYTPTVIEQGTPSAVDLEVAMRWAAHGFGLWLSILAAGELLRLVLKRIAGSELLGPFALFLAGALLIDPHWSLGLAIAVALACLAIISVYGGRSNGIHLKVAAPSASVIPGSPDATLAAEQSR
jgi:hypothetical protein